MADDDNPFGSEFQIISSKMNDNAGDAYPAIGPNSIPPGGQFPGGRNDETPF